MMIHFFNSPKNDTNALGFQITEFKYKRIHSSRDSPENTNDNKPIFVSANRYATLEKEADEINIMEINIVILKKFRPNVM